MNAIERLSQDLIVVGHGEADAVQRELIDPRAWSTVRYADPAAWVTATSVARALAASCQQTAALRSQVGLVVTSAEGSVETMATVSEAARAGFASPLRFPAANPASLAGVSCIAFGFQGPTLNLVLPSSRGVPLGVLLAGRWLRCGAAAYVVVAACSRRSPGRYLARSLLFTNRDGAAIAPPECQYGPTWLAATADDAAARST